MGESAGIALVCDSGGRDRCGEEALSPDGAGDRGGPSHHSRQVADTALTYLAKETAKKEAFARGEIPTGVAADELRQRGYRFV